MPWHIDIQVFWWHLKAQPFKKLWSLLLFPFGGLGLRVSLTLCHRSRIGCSWLNWLSWLSWLSRLSWLSFFILRLGVGLLQNGPGKVLGESRVGFRKASGSGREVRWQNIIRLDFSQDFPPKKNESFGVCSSQWSLYCTWVGWGTASCNVSKTFVLTWPLDLQELGG